MYKSEKKKRDILARGQTGFLPLLYLCECQLCGLTEKYLLMASGVGVLFMLLKPLDQWNGSLGSQLVARRII